MGPPRPTIAPSGRGAPLGETCLTPGARNQVTGARRAAPRPLCGGGSGVGSREAQGLGNFAETRARTAFARTREHHDTLKELEASFPSRPEGSREVVVGTGPQILFICFFLSWRCLLCVPSGRIHGLPSPVDADKLRPFATNLGNPFTRTGHRPAAGCPAASRGPFAVPPRSSSLLGSQGALLAPGSPRTLRSRTPGDQSTADRRFSVPNRRKVAPLLPSFAGYTLEPVTASQIPKRNEKRTK